MKRGITVRGDYDFHDRYIVVVEKARGKLTLDEIEDALRTNDRGAYCGNYVIILRCGEVTIGGSGWDIYEDPKGDAAQVYPVENLLDAMREEAEHRTRDGDFTAYWKYSGAVSMAKQVGFIDARKAAELIESARAAYITGSEPDQGEGV